jgi:hypothetical protein
VVALDANGSGTDEIYCDFGSSGLWVFQAGAWTKLSASDPDWIIGLEHGGTDYLLCDFGSAGLWYWHYNGAWPGDFVKISSANPEFGFTTDDDADGNDEVHFDFDTDGIWRYDMAGATTWMKLNSSSPETTSLRSDLWTAAHDEGAFGFGGVGFWTVLITGGTPSWSKINATNPGDDNVSAECGIGDAAEELICDFGASGLWLYDGSSWNKISSNEPHDIVAAVLPSDAGHEIFCAFNGTAGLWQWDWTGSYPGTWTLISGDTPDWDSGFCEPFDPNEDGWEELAIDYASNGLWIYDSAAVTKLVKINDNDPEFMVRMDYFGDGYDNVLIVDFGSGVGLWFYDGRIDTWTRLTTSSPDGVN